MVKEFLTTDEAAHVLRVSKKTVLRLIHAGELPARKVGKSWRLLAADVVRDYNAGGADEPVYLDDNASNPLDPRVLAVMVRLLNTTVGNASSAHLIGQRSRACVETAREQLAARVGARPTEVVFTSGATEANNLVLSGWPVTASRRRLVISAGEHASVIRVAEDLATIGRVTVSIVPLRSTGEVDLDALAALMADDVALVSVVAANGETGVLNPIREVAELAHAHGAAMHCDATQWVGRLPLDMSELDLDAVSLSGHKMCGPQGTGALIAHRRVLRQLSPLLVGGGHENGVRSGTYNVVGLAGLGAAATLAAEAGVAHRMAKTRDLFVERLRSIAGVTINGDTARRLPNTVNVRFAGVPGDVLLSRTPGVAASLGSACHSGAPEPSPTLLAMGLDREAATESVRFSTTRFTTPDDVERAAQLLSRSVTAIRELSQEVA